MRDIHRLIKMAALLICAAAVLGPGDLALSDDGFYVVGVGSPWKRNGSNIYYTAGNVGIGVEEPPWPLTTIKSFNGSVIYAANLDTSNAAHAITATASGDGTGVIGISEGSLGAGVSGVGHQGVIGQGVIGVWSKGQFICDNDSYIKGNSIVDGNSIVNGTKNAIVTTSQGRRKLYSQESPEVWFEDFGEGQLVGGTARIDLDPLFLETVTIDSKNLLKVFVQLKDDCNGVYVRPQATSFEVKELRSGNSSASFTYRVVAKRKGFETARLESGPESVKVANLKTLPAPKMSTALTPLQH